MQAARTAQADVDYSREKQELDSVLASGIFHRAPNLAHLLTYVCGKYFGGAAEQIKEYNIAVDALGRPAHFDQKRDSIVRVEAHRLRKRLREYYEADGADHSIRIDIPCGQYAPRFLPSSAPLLSLSAETLVTQGDPGCDSVASEHPVALVRQAEVASVEMAPVPVKTAVASERPSPARFRWRNQTTVAAALVVAAVVVVAVWRSPQSKAARLPVTAANADAIPANALEVRILAGHQNGDYTDRLGRVWQSDRYFQGGSVFEAHDRPIFGTREPRIYQSRREGAFSYDIPLAAGVYELRLHFAETLYGENNVAGGGESSRVFNVWINGKEALHEFDVIAESGASTADVRAFKDISPASDGKLHLGFEPFSNPPLLSAIEITSGTHGRLRPIRMCSLDRIYVDRRGKVWEPERYARGGQVIARSLPAESADDPELYRGEHFGNLRYAIPVPPGRYAVTFYFAEAWFGADTPAGGGVGSRVFDILCNGVELRRGFDIFKEAHGAGRGITWTAHGLEPDAQGKLNLALMPVRNYALLNALEVLDEAK